MQRTPEIIRLLSDAGFEFIIIGGVAAVAHGSVNFTVDLDVTAPFDMENATRLVAALAGHGPRHALTPDRLPLELEPKKLAAFKNLYIDTDIGRLDVLGETSVGSFAELRERAIEMAIEGHACLVMRRRPDLRVKEKLGREKDGQVVVELKAIRDVRSRD